MANDWWRVSEQPGVIGTPGDWYGFARRWTARRIDVSAPRLATRLAVLSDGGQSSSGGGSRPRTPSRPSVGDALRRRLIEVLQPPADLLAAPSGPLEWPSPLLPFQVDGVRILLATEQVLLADDMGLGKTVQTIAALRVLLHAGRIARALVVTPTGLLEQWRRELHLWAPELRVLVVAGPSGEREWKWRHPVHVDLVSYETLRSDTHPSKPIGPRRIAWDLVVLDEASRIKNRETEVAAACKTVPGARRWALTGTPLENRLQDVLSILEFLRGRSAAAAPPTEAAVRAELGRIQVRRRKEDVLHELPPKRIHDILIPLADAQDEAYQRLEQEGLLRLAEQGEAVTVAHVLELIMRLKQICNYDPVSGRSAKIEDIADRIETLAAEGHRALVFSQFTDELFGVGRLSRALEAFDPLELTGAMSQARRTAVVDRFRCDENHKVLILSLRAGGVGLNLQSASYVFHLDRWWNPAVEDQAEGRSHRMGQEYPVNAYRYVCAGTIEHRIAAKLSEKRALFRDVVDDVTLDLRTCLSEEELFGLFGLSAPRRQGRDSQDQPRREEPTVR